MKGLVTQAWTHHLPFMQQTVLLTAIRGPDGIAKYHPVKFLLRWFRRCTLVSSLDGIVLTTPHQAGGGSFCGPSFEVTSAIRLAGEHFDWRPAMDEAVDAYLKSVDELPHHFQLHLMHAVEICGYKHPDKMIRAWWYRVYERLVHDLHLWPETEAQLDHRLSDDREGWLARADKATVA